MAYNDFAFVYDSLMADADYTKRTDFVLKLFKKFGSVPTLLLDVACGTGKFSVEFAKKGIEVIGNDMSENMLSVARENAEKENLNILYLCQKAEELDLYGTVDGAVCLMDSINHITDKKSLLSAFKKISLFLEPQKLFVFDVNTVYKHEKVLADNTFVLQEENIYCVWQNKYRKKAKTTDITLDIFTNKNGIYNKSHEEFSEKAYTAEELTALLNKSGFLVEAIYGDLTAKKPKETEERIFFVCRKANT